MSNISQFFNNGGSSGVGTANLIGSLVQFGPAAKNEINDGTNVYLRCGYVKPFNVNYTASIAAAAELKVVGLADNKRIGAVAGGVMQVYYLSSGTRYLYIGSGQSIAKYNTALTDLSFTSVTNATGFVAPNNAAGFCNSSYVVLPTAANSALQWSSNGVNWAQVGGTWTSTPLKTAISYGNSKWLAISSLNGTAGEIAYINNAVPTGAWTTTPAAANYGQTATNSIAYNPTAGVWCAVGSGSASIGLVLTSTNGTTWVDRTASCGIAITGSSASNLVWTGQNFIAKLDTRWASSTDGQTWALIDAATSNSVNYTNIATDGGGKVVITGTNNSGIYSSDHGATWTPFQVTTTATQIGYAANQLWIATTSGVSFISVTDAEFTLSLIHI